MLEIGTKIRKMRELLDINQEYMADRLGISQQMYSTLEKDPNIPYARLEEIAGILQVPVEAITAFDKTAYFNNIHDNNGSVGMNIIQPLNTKMEKLYEDKIKLLEEKMQLLEKQLKDK